MKIRFLCMIQLILFVLLLFCQPVSAQERNIIKEIVVTSNYNVPATLVINQSGLKVGNPLSGDSASQAIRTLWRLGIFSDVRIKSEPVDGGLKINIDVKLLPVVNEITTDGFDEISKEEAITAIGIVRNQAVGDRKIAKMTNQLLDMYKEKGFLLADVNFHVTPVPTDSTKIDVFIKVTQDQIDTCRGQ
ncbi:POTRA domain-containing protein [Candidatus Omnitrophota bacterium]